MKTKSTPKIDLDKIDVIHKGNYEDTPELMDEFLKIALRSKSKHKITVSLRLDDDIVEFFKKINKQYQTKINDVLRAYKIAYEKVHH